jgi:hypothetical protein
MTLYVVGRKGILYRKQVYRLSMLSVESARYSIF